MGEGAESALAAPGPDFVGIGAQKSGTTWLGDVLAQHPGVYIRKKEISFFVQNFHRGFEWYHEFFRDKGARRAGELTVSYLITPRSDPAHKETYPRWNPRRALLFWRSQPSAREELVAHYPEVRVFVILRNPVDRAWSHYWYWRRRRERLGKRVVSFERMFEDDGRWIQSYGHYADYLPAWLETFPDLGIFFYDDIETDPLGLARRIYRFIGVDDSFDPEVRKQMNPGRYERLPDELRKRLVEVYADSNQRLVELTGRDLADWSRV